MLTKKKKKMEKRMKKFLQSPVYQVFDWLSQSVDGSGF